MKLKDKLKDESDASTTVSTDHVDSGNDSSEDFNINPGEAVRKDTCWSDDEGGMEMYMQNPFMNYGYCDMDQWWMSMMPMDGTFMMPDGTFMPQNWAEGDMNCAGDNSIVDGQEWRTTVMLRNMPNNYTRDMLLELVDAMGFEACYDFAYLPVDFKSQAGLGYAFINFVTPDEAQRCFEQFEGFSDWKVPSEKVCTVTWGSPYQGLEAHVERYQNSPVMHHSIPDEWKPVLFDHEGRRIAFPPPTKAIKTPKVRTPTGI